MNYNKCLLLEKVGAFFKHIENLYFSDVIQSMQSRIATAW